MTNKKKIQVLPLIILIALTAAFFIGGGRLQRPGGSPGASLGVTQRSEAASDARDTTMQSPAATAQPGDKQAVAAYIKAHGRLPDYYITKDAARARGWSGGSLEPYAPGHLIGGDRFGNYEGLLPQGKGRVYRECDIGTYKADSRGVKRLVFSDDGLIYYTDDHYSSFTKLAGED